MAKIVIRLKSGFELPIECEKAKFKPDLFGGCESYTLKGIKDNRPIHLNPSDIECVYQIMDQTEEEDGGLD